VWHKVKTITDKHGEKYKVVIDDDECDPVFKVFTADARIQETQVGYSNCRYEGDGILTLVDIRFLEDLILVYRRTGFFRMFQEPKREKRSFRQRGLGTELLNCVFAFAEEKGIEQIVGRIKAVDYPKNPNLPKWYADMGFTVMMEADPMTVQGRISKRL